MCDSNRWVVTVARNNLELTKQAVTSFERQEGGANVLVVNNGSTDATASWLHGRPDIVSMHFNPQHGLAHAWNAALRYLFTLGGTRRVERVLVCNNDVVLRPDTWKWLEAEQADFVTAVGSSDPASVQESSKIDLLAASQTFYWPAPHPGTKRPHPDFSCFMISRWCFEHIGPFDERFRGAYCEDADYHCRMHELGVAAYSIDLPFWHIGGGAQTIKRSAVDEQEEIAKMAARNRQYFKEKWGFEVPSAQNGGRDYYAFFGHDAPEPERSGW